MPHPPKLTVYALGPVQVFRDEQLLTDWKYLDSVELLFYLLHYTRKPKLKPGQAALQTENLHGKTKEQIGLELWPDASTRQLASKLKVRLYDLRRVLGDGDLILFENGQYKFNATRAYWYDAEAFAEAIAAAERLSASAPAQAIEQFQNAVQLYRGDFLADLRPRRARRETAREADDGQEGSGREWQMTVQDHLLGLYLKALHKLAKLLMGEGAYEPAAEAYRLAAAKDDYDDDAHHGLIYCLAWQGKRSQALEHYRRLLKRRGDTPPGPEIVALAERLQRGEELAPRPSPAPALAPGQPAEAAAPEPAAPFQVPADLPRFVGREQEAGLLTAAMAAALTSAAPTASAAAEAAAPRRFWLGGMGGVGKTSLAVHLAHALRDQFPDGVLWAHASTSEPMAVLDSWARAYGCDYSGLPDLESRAAALRALLADKQVLLILDDVWDAARARPLLVGGPRSTVLLTGRDLDLAEALDAQITSMPVFAADESHELLARPELSGRVAAEPAEADTICQLLGHLPLALDIAAQRLASRPNWSLRELAGRLREQHQRLALLKIGDREVRASFLVSWQALDEPLRQAFARLGVFAGRAFAAPALAAVAADATGASGAAGTSSDAGISLAAKTALDEPPKGDPRPDRSAQPSRPVGLAARTGLSPLGGEPAARDQLDALVSLSLLSVADSRHYRQHPLLADFAREHLAEAQAAEARMAHYYLRYATEQRQHYLALEEEWDNLAAGLAVAHEQKLWQLIIDYGDVLTNAWFALGRFSYARQAFPFICGAARELEEQDPYIAATINWGRACIEQGDYDEATERLRHALQTSREVRDEHGIASAQFHLGWVALEQSRTDEAGELLRESQLNFEYLGDRAGAGETLFHQARIAYKNFNYADVVKLGQQALELFRTSDSHLQTIHVLRYLALAAGHQGQHAQADQYCQAAMKICDDLNLQAARPDVYYVWMQLCYRRGDIDLARQYGERSLPSFMTIGDRKSYALALEYLSRIYIDLHNYHLAEEKARQSLAMLQELHDDWNVVLVLRGLGNLYRRTNRPDEARAVWTEAEATARRLKHPLEQEIQKLLLFEEE